MENCASEEKPSKICPKCRESKLLSDFYVDKRTKSGYTVYCKPCNRKVAQAYRAANRELVRERNRAAKATSGARAKARAAYWAKPEVYREKALRNKDLQLAADAESRRRARMRGAGMVEKIDRLEIYERDGGRCHICGRLVARTSFQLDHLVPIARGGTHIATNVAVAHRVCNQRRGPGRIDAQLRIA